MKSIFFFTALFISLIAAAQQHAYKIVKTYHIASPGGWDYLAVHNGMIYVSHASQVNILNEQTGDSAGIIPNTNGVHGIAFDNALNRGYTSNGRTNNITVFDLATNAVIQQVGTGENPDAILFEPYTGMIITCNGRSKNLSVIDPKTNQVLATIDVGGKPETAVSNGAGKLFVNIEDRNEIAVIDLKQHKVQTRWPLGGAEGPTGLAFDPKSKRLFAGCDKWLVVVNAEDGNVVTKLPIGKGCDGVAFDGRRATIYTSNGEGSMTVIKEVSPQKFTVEGNYPTKPGARTITMNEKTGTVYMPTADFDAQTTADTRRKMIPGTFQVLVIK
ncbi:MAG TPA: YncE family protein [Flavisolibacter sp.]|nr:YncE family protein [Flavisolibacter sp.]